MTTKKTWSSLQEAAEATQISPTVLRELKSTGALPAGEAWIYLTGSRRGRVGWSIPAIQKWQTARTMQIVQEPTQRAALVETYDVVR